MDSVILGMGEGRESVENTENVVGLDFGQNCVTVPRPYFWKIARNFLSINPFWNFETVWKIVLKFVTM